LQLKQRSVSRTRTEPMKTILAICVAILIASLGCSASRTANGGAAGANSGANGDAACTTEWPDQCKVCTDDATCSSPSYKFDGDGTVSSSCCGLVWQQDVGQKQNWDDAKAFCAGLQLPGAGWRLPTISELQSLVVLGQIPMNPTVDRTAFPNTPSIGFWSSSPYLHAPHSAWVVLFHTGEVTNGVTDGSAAARCVR
jgi:Protein of unknown function (DUF1566)